MFGSVIRYKSVTNSKKQMTYLVRWTGGPAASAATSWAALWEAVLLEKKIKHVVRHGIKHLLQLLALFFCPLPVLFLALLVVWFIIVDFCLLILILVRIWSLTLAACSWLGLIGACLRPSSVCKSSPVRSFGPKMQDRDRDWFTIVLEPKKTRPDRPRPVFIGLLRSWIGLGRNW